MSKGSRTIEQEEQDTKKKAPYTKLYADFSQKSKALARGMEVIPSLERVQPRNRSPYQDMNQAHQEAPSFSKKENS